MGTISKRRLNPLMWDSDLHEFLVSRLRDGPVEGLIRDDRLDVALMGKMCDVSAQSVYTWIMRDKLSPKAAKAIAAMSAGRITELDLFEFVMR